VSLVLVLDTETTGLPDFKAPSDAPHQPHLVEIAALLYDGAGNLIDSFDAIIRPDGWESCPEALAAHGITHEQAMAEGIPEADALAAFYALHERASLRVAHNQSFDARILRIAIKRYMSDADADAWSSQPAFCTMNTAKPIMQLPPTAAMRAKKFFGPKPPTLAEALKFFTGDDHVDAHRARSDAEACARIYFAMQAKEAA